MADTTVVADVGICNVVTINTSHSALVCHRVWLLLLSSTLHSASQWHCPGPGSSPASDRAGGSCTMHNIIYINIIKTWVLSPLRAGTEGACNLNLNIDSLPAAHSVTGLLGSSEVDPGENWSVTELPGGGGEGWGQLTAHLRYRFLLTTSRHSIFESWQTSQSIIRSFDYILLCSICRLSFIMSTHNICKEIILFLTEPIEKFSLTTLHRHLDITLGPVIMQIYKLADALLITPYDVPYNWQWNTCLNV